MVARFPKVKFEENPTELHHPTLRALNDYWKSKRGSRRMPSRADIRPAEIKEHLPWVVVVEALPGLEDFRYRLVGTLVTRYFSRDPTGHTVREAWASQGAETTQRILTILRGICHRKQLLRVYGEADWSPIGLEEFQCLYMPLSDDGETVNVILNGFVFNRPEVLFARDTMQSTHSDFLSAPRVCR